MGRKSVRPIPGPCPVWPPGGQESEKPGKKGKLVHAHTLSDLPDQELVRQAQLAQEAFNILVDRHWQDVYRLAQTHLRAYCGAQACDSDAEDVTQEVFVRAYLKLGHFDLARNTSFRTWLLGITLNCCREARRHIWRRQRDRETLDWGGQENESADFDLWLNIHDTLRELPEAERQILLLHYYDGYSWSEIAEALGEKTETVKKRAQRALHKVRRTLKAA
jgi:RNA polymerase sigma factor (sigma-70 family)